MKEQISKYVSLWNFGNLSENPSISHFVSGKLNLSYKVGDSVAQVTENRNLLSSSLNISSDKLLFPDQTHSSNVAIVEDLSQSLLENTDAVITNKIGIYISVMAADCVPVLLYDKVNKVIGAVHAGWRGTTAKILTKTIWEMQCNFETDPQDLLIGIGPSICSSVYEIGTEVAGAVIGAFGEDGKNFLSFKNGKQYLNLWEANTAQALLSGVPKANIEIAGICTYLNEDKFFSARKSGINTGRFAAGIMLL